jgi:hypothetical protein
MIALVKTFQNADSKKGPYRVQQEVSTAPSKGHTPDPRLAGIFGRLIFCAGKSEGWWWSREGSGQRRRGQHSIATSPTPHLDFTQSGQ